MEYKIVVFGHHIKLNIILVIVHHRFIYLSNTFEVSTVSIDAFTKL